jgi:hypothetical protein
MMGETIVTNELIERDLPPESEPNDFIPNLRLLKLVEAGIFFRLVRLHF